MMTVRPRRDDGKLVLAIGVTKETIRHLLFAASAMRDVDAGTIGQPEIGAVLLMVCETEEEGETVLRQNGMARGAGD